MDILIDIVFFIVLGFGALTSILVGGKQIYDIYQESNNNSKLRLWEYILFLIALAILIVIGISFSSLPFMLFMSLNAPDWSFLILGGVLIIFFISLYKNLYDLKMKDKVISVMIEDKKLIIYTLLGVIGGAIVTLLIGYIGSLF